MCLYEYMWVHAKLKNCPGPFFLGSPPSLWIVFLGTPTPPPPPPPHLPRHPWRKKNSTFFVIKYFRFYLFLYKSVLWGHYTHYPSNPPLKSEICQAAFFWKFGRKLNQPQSPSWNGEVAHYGMRWKEINVLLLKP